MAKPYHVLNTRPGKAGEKLALSLSHAGFKTTLQPLFDYQAKSPELSLQTFLENNQNITVIFVSVAAVDFCHKQQPLTQWLTDNTIKQVLAVGQATSSALTALGIKNQYPNQQDSEGLLALPSLQKPQLNGAVLIVRGDSGRELLADNLKKMEINVEYLSCYQRKWRQFNSNLSQKWRQSKINCIVITSNKNLMHLISAINCNDNYWQKECLWLCASERIATSAKALSLQNVINIGSANDDAIIQSLQNMD